MNFRASFVIPCRGGASSPAKPQGGAKTGAFTDIKDECVLLTAVFGVKNTCKDIDTVISISGSGLADSKTEPIILNFANAKADIAAKHTPAEAKIENKIDATCEAAGSYDSVVYCKDCEKEISRTKTEIPKGEHSYGDNGICSVCNRMRYSFLSASLSLANDIAVNFKANKEKLDAAGFESVYATFEFNGKTYKVTEYKIETMLISGAETEVYVFPFENLAPDKMNDTITATLYASFGGEEYASKSVSYSVAQYCYNQLKKLTEKTALATVCVDLLNYGAASQKYTDHNVENLANAGLTDTQRSWGTQEERELVDVMARDNAPAVETAKWRAAALKLKSNITVEMKFATDDVTGMYVEIEMRGKTFRVDKLTVDSNGFYVAEFNSFFATHMSEVIKATVRDADGNAVSKVLTYSVESYSARNQDSEDVGDLVKAMMKYGDAAVAYANEN